MEYIGLDKQIRKNNFKSILLLIAFPVLLLLVFQLIFFFGSEENEGMAGEQFLSLVPFILIGTGIWFLIAWAGHSAMIRKATGSKPLERMENKRVYNLLENLCITQGMPMPKLYIIEDNSMNAFASGINTSSFSISLSRGMIERMEDDELEGVLAHELTHIRNRDVRLLIISIIFVGIFSFLAEMTLRSLRFSGSSKKRKDGKGSGGIILIILAITLIAYLLSLLLRFGISRKREYLADAGSAELTKKPYALASALRKIANDPLIEAIKRRDVAQLFIENPKSVNPGLFSIGKMFATHPPIEKRIELLEQFV